MNTEVIDLINDIDEDLSTLKVLAGLAPLLDGQPEYFPHAVLILQLSGEISDRMETRMSNLVSQLRSQEGQL